MLFALTELFFILYYLVRSNKNEIILLDTRLPRIQLFGYVCYGEGPWL